MTLRFKQKYLTYRVVKKAENGSVRMPSFSSRLTFYDGVNNFYQICRLSLTSIPGQGTRYFNLICKRYLVSYQAVCIVCLFSSLLLCHNGDSLG